MHPVYLVFAVPIVWFCVNAYMSPEAREITKWSASHGLFYLLVMPTLLLVFFLGERKAVKRQPAAEPKSRGQYRDTRFW
jgi:hypothetical protein